MNINSDLSSQVSEQQEKTSTKQPSLAVHWGFSSRYFPSSVLLAEGSAVVSGVPEPPPYSYWVRTHVTTRENRYTSTTFQKSMCSFRSVHDLK